MSDHVPCPNETFFPSENQETSDGKWLPGSSANNNHNMPLVISDDDPLISLWHSPLFSATSLQEPNHTAGGADHYSYILNDLSTAFEEAPPPLLQAGPAEIPHSEEIIVHDNSEKGQSSSTNMKEASHSMEMQTQDQIHEDGGKKVCREYKRKHSGEAYNLSTRLRRQKFNGKMKTLQELIPKCSKRDKDSIVDDAIKYIKNLQHQLQYFQGQQNGSSSGAGFPMSGVYPWMMPASQIGMQIPTGLPQFPHTFPGMEYAMGMGMFYPNNISELGLSNSSQLGLHNPCTNLLASTSSGLMQGISESAQDNSSNIIPNNPGNNINIAFEPWSGQFTAQGGSSHDATPDL